MDIVVELEDGVGQDLALELGRWVDLEILVDLLNNAGDCQYDLQKVKGKKNLYMFVEAPFDTDEWGCGMIKKRGALAFAMTSAAHELVIEAYQTYVARYGEPELEEIEV